MKTETQELEKLEEEMRLARKNLNAMKKKKEALQRQRLTNRLAGIGQKVVDQIPAKDMWNDVELGKVFSKLGIVWPEVSDSKSELKTDSDSKMESKTQQKAGTQGMNPSPVPVSVSDVNVKSAARTQVPVSGVGQVKAGAQSANPSPISVSASDVNLKPAGRTQVSVLSAGSMPGSGQMKAGTQGMNPSPVSARNKSIPESR